MTHKLLIGLTGPARSGKSTAQRMIAERYGLTRINFADPLKDAISAMLMLSDEELNGKAKERPLTWLGKSPRELMQTLGTEWGREMVGRDFWIRLAQRRLRLIAEIEANDYRGAVFSDARFDDEAQWIRDHGGVILRLYRPSAPRVRKHASEAGPAVHDSDISIPNTGGLERLETRLAMELDDLIARRAAA